MDNKKEEKLKIGEVIKSVLAAMFGVQSEKNRNRDFKQSSLLPFVVVGIVMIALLILSIIGGISLLMTQY